MPEPFPLSVVQLLNEEISCVCKARSALYDEQQLWHRKINQHQVEIDKLTQYEREIRQSLSYYEALKDAKS